MTVLTRNMAPGEDVLLRELHQRVGNGLATAVPLVLAAAVRAEAAETKTALSNVVELLHGQAEVHRALAMPEGEALIDAATYIRKLGTALRRSMLDRMNIRLAFVTECAPLQSQRCWRLGLIVHDLIANAARHACFDGRAGEIKVRLSRIGALVNCVVLDNGSRSTRAAHARELRISNDLAKGLSSRVEHGFGTEFTSVVLSFRMTDRERQANWTMAVRRMRSPRRLQTNATVAALGAGTGDATLPAAARSNPDLPEAQRANDASASAR